VSAVKVGGKFLITRCTRKELCSQYHS